jgi:hypothetical protein
MSPRRQPTQYEIRNTQYAQTKTPPHHSDERALACFCVLAAAHGWQQNIPSSGDEQEPKRIPLIFQIVSAGIGTMAWQIGKLGTGRLVEHAPNQFTNLPVY